MRTQVETFIQNISDEDDIELNTSRYLEPLETCLSQNPENEIVYREGNVYLLQNGEIDQSFILGKGSCIYSLAAESGNIEVSIPEAYIGSINLYGIGLLSFLLGPSEETSTETTISMGDFGENSNNNNNNNGNNNG